MTISDSAVDISIDPEGTITVGPRTIPLPGSISEPMRRALSAQPPPQDAVPSPDDKDAWRQLVEQWNAASAPAVDAVLQATKELAAIETVTLGETVVHVGTPTRPAGQNRERAVITVHGGGFILFGGAAARRPAAEATAQWNCPSYSVDYRMPPDHPYPAALDDTLAVYRYVLERHEPANVVLSGQSSGAALAAGAILRARDEGLPLPGALMVSTPECDMTESGDSFHTLQSIDPRLPAWVSDAAKLYVGDHDPADPYLSPIFADFSRGFPPALVQSGTRDVFLSNAVRLHRALRDAEVEAELHVWDAVPHHGLVGFAPGAAENAEIIAEQTRFLAKHGGPAWRG